MTPEQKDLLHSLTFLYLRHGQNKRALSLIMLAARRMPDDVGLMRTLAFAFIANGAAEEALEVIERLERLDLAVGAVQMRQLLKARALLHAGRIIEARAVFRQFVDARKNVIKPLADFGMDPEPADQDGVLVDLTIDHGDPFDQAAPAKPVEHGVTAK